MAKILCNFPEGQLPIKASDIFNFVTLNGEESALTNCLQKRRRACPHECSSAGGAKQPSPGRKAGVNKNKDYFRSAVGPRAAAGGARIICINTDSLGNVLYDQCMPPMEPSNLLRELRRTANELLNGEGIYPILNYGWEDHDTPSSEYVGLAMWTTTGPFEPDLGVWERTTPPINPTKRDEILYTAGEDFVGTMELARDSFGMTLYSWQHRKPSEVLDDEELFWEYHASTILWLNIASDRVRDFFMMARFGMSPEKYKDAYSRNRGYADPSRMHQSNEGKLASEAAVILQPFAEQLGAFRTTRNKIVHEIASRDGRNAAESISLQRQEAQQTSSPPPQPLSIPDFEKSKEIIKELEEGKQSELRRALQQLREWYLLLIRAGSLVFEFEYWKRFNR